MVLAALAWVVEPETKHIAGGMSNASSHPDRLLRRWTKLASCPTIGHPTRTNAPPETKNPTMTSRRCALIALTISLVALATTPRLGLAHEKDFDTHPARDIVISYLAYAMGQDWPKAAALIDLESLTGLRDRYIARISSARIVQEELEMCRALDCLNLAEVKKLDPTDFYLRYHKGIEERYKVSAAKLETINKSKQVKVLSLVEESHDGKDLAHVLVRTKHDNGDKQISSLELISLSKAKGKWLVILDASKPTITDTASATGEAGKK